MSSNVTLSSENKPPWSTKYFFPTSVARGKAEKLSEKSLNTLSHTVVSTISQERPLFTSCAPLVVFGFAFSLESIHPVHVIRLMVTSVEEKAVRS